MGGVLLAGMLQLRTIILRSAVRPRGARATIPQGRSNGGGGAVLSLALRVGTLALLHVSVARAGLDEGLRAYQSGNYSVAAQELLQSAKHGDARAQANLGAMYALGKGVGEDSGEALNWLSKSAKQGYWRAQNALGWFYFGGFGVARDLVQAYAWFSISAESATGDDRETQARARDSIVPLLTPEQLFDAQRRVKELRVWTNPAAEIPR